MNLIEFMNYNFNPAIFKAYDIRGEIKDGEIDERSAFFIGLCLGSIIKEGIVCVGMDARSSSGILKKQLTEGLILMGIDVVDLGLIPTPLCYFSIPFLKAKASIMVTGSHNPINYNGFKITLENKSLSGEDLLQFIPLAKEGFAPVASKGTVRNFNIAESYISKILHGLNFQKTDLRIGIDAMNGSGGLVLEMLSKHLPFNFILRNCKMTGDFSEVLPEPSKPSNIVLLQNFFKEENLDLLFAFDGDADRVLLLTKEKVWYGDDIILLLSSFILKQNPDRSVIFDVKSSIKLEEEIKKLNGVPVIYRTGHSLIKQKMKEIDAVLAGEMSGHIYINDGKFYPFDDGIYCFVRILEYLHNLKEIPIFQKTFRTPEMKMKIQNKSLFLKNLKDNLLQMNPIRVLEIDGIKAYFEGGSAVLARASNTEDVIIIIIESNNELQLEGLINKVLSFSNE